MKRAKSILLALMATLAGSPAYSDTLLMEAIARDSSNHRAGLPRPSRGMAASSVLEGFGEPMERLPAVGHPPIARWRYPGYTVYFEYDRVLRSVLRRPRRGVVTQVK